MSRFVLVALALAAAVWLGISLGSARAGQRAFGVAYSGPKPSAAQIGGALADARAARRVDADAPAKLLEWRLLFRRGERARARSLLLDVVRAEPANYEAWVYLTRTAGDPAIERRARARLRALHPPS